MLKLAVRVPRNRENLRINSMAQTKLLKRLVVLQPCISPLRPASGVGHFGAPALKISWDSFP
jgi:hypothetical protein